MNLFFKRNWPLLIIILLGLIPLWWFREGYIYAGGDNTIYINPAATFFNFHFSWLDKIDTGRPNLIKAIAFPFSFFWFYLAKLGFALVNSQRLWVVLHFMLPGITMYFLIRYLYDSSSKKGAVAALFGSLLYMFNPLVMMDAFSLGLRPLLIFFPLLLLFLMKGLDQERFSLKYPSLIALISIGYCTANINLSFVLPMYFVLFFYVVFFMVKTKRFKQAIFISFSTIILALLVNLWWISDSLLAMVGSNDIIAVIRSYNFLERTSIYETFRLMGSWAFRIDFNGMKNYPYSSNYYQFPVVFTTYFVPFFAFLSLLFNKNRKEKIFFAFLALIGIFLAKGIRFPFGGFYQYLYDNVPGFGVFREPFYKFSIIHLLAFSVLVGCFVEDFGHYLKEKISAFFIKRFSFVVVFFLYAVLTAIIFSTGFPLLTGKNVQDKNWYKDSRYSLFVKVPDYWEKIHLWFEKNDPLSRVIVFPRTYYGQSYNWPLGVTVGDPVAEYLIPNPVIRRPMYLNTGHDRLAGLPYELIGDEEKTDLFPFFDLLAIRYVLQQNDAFPNEFMRVFGPEKMKIFLEEQKKLKRVERIGNLDIYEVIRDNPAPLIYQAGEIVYVSGGLESLIDIFPRYQYKSGSLFLFSKEAPLLPEVEVAMASKILIPIRTADLPNNTSFSFEIPRAGSYQLLVDDVFYRRILKTSRMFSLTLNGRSFLLGNNNNKVVKNIDLGNLKEGVYTLTVNLPIAEPQNENSVNKAPFLLVGDFSSGSAGQQATILSYQKLNPSRYKINVQNTGKPITLIFNSTFDKKWSISTKEFTLRSQHFLANGYSNGWYIETPELFDGSEYELEIEYSPQKVADISLYLSLFTIATILLYFIFNRKTKFSKSELIPTRKENLMEEKEEGKTSLSEQIFPGLKERIFKIKSHNSLFVFLIRLLAFVLYLYFLFMKYKGHQVSIDIIFSLLVLGWILNVIIQRFSYKISILLGLIFLCLCPFWRFYGQEKFAQDSATLAFLFISFSVCQQLSIFFKRNKIK